MDASSTWPFLSLAAAIAVVFFWRSTVAQIDELVAAQARTAAAVKAVADKVAVLEAQTPAVDLTAAIAAENVNAAALEALVAPPAEEPGIPTA